MSKTKLAQRRQIVRVLVSSGVEKKRAHSEAGYMLNRWPFAAVCLAVASTSDAEDPAIAAVEFLRAIPEKGAA